MTSEVTQALCIAIHPICGACGTLFVQGERVAAVFQDPQTNVFKTLNVGYYFREGGFWSRNADVSGPAVSEQSRFFSEAAEGRLGDAASKCSTTVHVDCLNLFMRNSTVNHKLQRLWLVSTWRYPWLQAEPLRLPPPDETAHDEEVLGAVLNMDAYRKAPLEIKRLIWEYTNVPILKRFRSVLGLCHQLSMPAEDDDQIIRLCQVRYWTRGSRLDFCEAPLETLIRLTIDGQGLAKIEQVGREQPGRPQSSNNLVYVVETAEVMREAMVEIKCGLARLVLPPTLQGFHVWDISNPPMPTPSSLSLLGISPYARFATIDTRDCTGITFLYAGSTLVGVHAHRAHSSAAASAASAANRLPRQNTSKSLVWLYLPLSKTDRIIGFGVCVLMQEGRTKNDRPTILARLEKSGSIALGPDYTAERQTRMLATSTEPGPILMHETGGASISAICALTSANSAVPVEMAPLNPFSLCDLEGLCFSSARLDGVTFAEVYYDSKAFYCRGIILTYRNGAKRVLGQCRVGVDRSRTCESPVKLRVFGKVILSEDREQIQVVGIEFRTDTEDWDDTFAGDWADMEGVLEFWFTAKEAMATLITGESVSAALTAYDAAHPAISGAE